jgi:hypothetical protein
LRGAYLNPDEQALITEALAQAIPQQAPCRGGLPVKESPTREYGRFGPAHRPTRLGAGQAEAGWRLELRTWQRRVPGDAKSLRPTEAAVAMSVWHLPRLLGALCTIARDAVAAGALDPAHLALHGVLGAVYSDPQHPDAPMPRTTGTTAAPLATPVERIAALRERMQLLSGDNSARPEIAGELHDLVRAAGQGPPPELASTLDLARRAFLRGSDYLAGIRLEHAEKIARGEASCADGEP